MSPSVRKALKIVGMLTLMTASGIVCYAVCFVVFMMVGDAYYGNYEHLLQYPILILLPLVLGFFAPLLLVLAWKRSRKGEP